MINWTLFQGVSAAMLHTMSDGQNGGTSAVAFSEVRRSASFVICHLKLDEP